MFFNILRGKPMKSFSYMSTEFKKMFDAEIFDYAQPSITKVGGI